jgi:hypothetical protein
MSEELAMLIRRSGLVIKKTVIRRGEEVVGEYIYVRRGLFEAEAEFDLEDNVLYYLQMCWLRRCYVWFDGEPDRAVPNALIKRAISIFRELGEFSVAARAVLRMLASSKSRSSHVRSSDPFHRLT